MKDHDEPQRLFESPEAPPGLRSLLVRAHEDHPSWAERELLIRGATAWKAGTWGAMQGRAWSVRWVARAARHSAKILSMAAVVGVGAGALYVSGLQQRHSARSSQPVSTAPLAAVVEEKAAGVVEEPGETPGAAEEPGSGGGVAAGHEPAVALPALPRARSATRSHPRRGRSIAKVAPEVTVRSRQNESTNIRTQQPASAASPRQGEEAGPSEVGPPRPLDKPLEAEAIARAELLPPPREDLRVSISGTEEATLLRSARQALARSPERTLSLTDEHLRRFSRGILDQEREALAIEALIKLGRIDKARARAHAFERAYRDSPHRARIERAFMRVPGGLAPP